MCIAMFELLDRDLQLMQHRSSNNNIRTIECDADNLHSKHTTEWMLELWRELGHKYHTFERQSLFHNA
jgi:hypothetical protein